MVNQYVLKYGRVRSCIRELFEYGKQQAAIVGPDNVYDFSIGNPSVPPPEELKQAFIDVIENESPLMVHGYTSAVGSNDARDAIAKALSERMGKNFTRRNFYITCGAAAALISSIKAFAVDHDSEAICFAPFFPEYSCFIDSAGMKQVIVPPDMDKFQINFPELEKALSPNTRCVIINSPNNPSGAILTRETLEKLAKLLTEKSAEYGHTIYIISDEPYRELVYGDIEVPYVPDIYPNTIICYSYSKSLSIPGDRLGYMMVPDCMENFDDVCDATSGAARVSGYVCAPAVVQRVIARCAHLMPDLTTYETNRALLYNALTEMGYECVHPDGAFYLFFKAPNGDGNEFSEMAKKHNLLIVPGEGFGCKEYLRASYCVDTDMIKRSLPAFKALMDEVKNA